MQCLMDRDAEYRIYDRNVEIHINGVWKLIGKLNPATRTYIKYENVKGLHKKTDSFGMPYTILNWLREHDYNNISVFYNRIYYRTTLNNWLEKGVFLYFKGRSEKRMYLKREDFK